MEQVRYSYKCGDRVVAFVSTRKDGMPEREKKTGTVVGAYDGFVRVRIDGTQVPISVPSLSCYRL